MAVLFAGTPARAADQIINSFELTDGSYRAWSARPTLCAVSPTCPTTTGPCVTLFTTSSTALDGSVSGQVWLEEDQGSNEECGGVGCDGLHPLTLSNFAPKDWSTGYTKILMNALLPQSGVSVRVQLAIYDTAGNVALSQPVDISTAGTWNEVGANLSFLQGEGLTLSKIDHICVIFPVVNGCTSVLIDSLRLTAGSPPCTPNSVSALPGNQKVTLNWVYPLPCADPFPIAQYCVYRSTVPLSATIPVPLPPYITKQCGVPNPFTDSPLVNGTTYHYKVTAIDTDGVESAAGDAGEDDFATPTCGGSAPSVSAVAFGGGIRVVWAGALPDQWRIYRTGAGGTCATKGTLLTMLPGASSFYDDRSGTPDETYCYTVTAVVGICEGPCSNTSCAVNNGSGLPPCSPPGPILGLSAVAKGVSVILSWSAAAAGDTPVSGYQVYRGLSPGGPKSPLAPKVFDNGSPSYTMTDTGFLQAVTQYCYQVVAVAADTGCSSTSSEQCVTTGCDLVPPSFVSAVAWCSLVRLGWSTVPATQIKIYRQIAGGACAAPLYDTMPGVSVYFDDVNVVDGTTYAYVVKASGVACDSVCSAEVTALAMPGPACPPTPPCTPPGMVPTPTGSTGSAHVTVTWTRPIPGGSPLSRYFVWFGPGPGGGGLAGKAITATVWDVDGPTFTVTIGGLSVNSQYCAIVEVADDGLPSCTNFSAESCFSTSCVTPAPPGMPVIAAIPPNSLFLGWTPATAMEPGVQVSRYLVFRATVSGGPRLLSGTTWDAGPLTLTFTDTGVTLSRDIFYQVMAVDGQGCTIWSAEAFHGCTPPGLMPAIGVAARAPSSLLVSWPQPARGEPSVPLSKYFVFRSSGAGFTQTLSATAYDSGAGLDLSVTIGGLNLTQEWCFQVMAVDQAGCTVWSDPPPATGCRVCAPPSPAGPAGLSGLPPNAVLLQWSRPAAGDTGISRYLILRSTAVGAAQAFFGTVYDDGVNTSYTFTNVGAATTGSWCYEILTYDQGGCSQVSPDFCYSCAAPQWGIGHEGTATMTAAKVNSTDVWVSWDFARPGDTMNRAVTWNPVTRYFVFRSTGPTCYAQQVCATLWEDQVSLSFAVTVTGLSPDTPYSFEVMAISRNGCATLSLDCAVARTSVCQPQWLANAPPACTSGGGASISIPAVVSTTVLVTWDYAPPGDTGGRATTANPVSRYIVFRNRTAPCSLEKPSGTIWDDQVALKFSLTVGGLDPATQYFFEIVAVSEDGCATRSCDCPPGNTQGACSFMGPLSAWAVTGPTGTPAVGLQWGWTSTGSVIEFDILRGDAPTGGSSGKTQIAAAPASAITWTDPTVAPGKTYYYVVKLRAAQPLGLPDCEVYSSEAGVSLPALKLAVFPNPGEPSKQPIRFDGLPAGAVVEIYTLNGEIVRKSPAGATGALWLWDGKNDDGTPVAPGIYLWIVRAESGLTRGKIVVGK